MLYGYRQDRWCLSSRVGVLILIFLENALRRDLVLNMSTGRFVLILIFLENALRQDGWQHLSLQVLSLNPYFFGKCSTARSLINREYNFTECLNPYFFGKCSTA